MATLTPTELRLQNRNDRLEMLINQQEELLRERGEGNLSDTDKGQLERMRSEQSELITEIDGLVSDKESHDKAVERSKAIRASMLGANGGTEFAEDGVVYRDFLSYARDELLARSVSSSGELAHLATSWGGENAVAAAQARLELIKRTPANTLSSNVAGLTPAQHIAQIFQVIDKSRPIVQSAQRTDLERLTLTYPRVDTKPIVAVQASQKTEAGNTGLASRCRPRPPHVPRRRRPVVAGDQLVDAERAATCGSTSCGGLRVEDGAGRGAGDAALRVRLQHRQRRSGRRRRSRSS
jgi:hypothetical protein